MKKQLLSLLLVASLCLSLLTTAVASTTDQPRNPLITTEEMGYEEVVAYVLSEYPDAGIDPQWSSGDPDGSNFLTHGFIAEKAVALLRTNASVASTANLFYSSTRINALLKGSVLPDVDENDNLYLWHFYGPNGTTYDGSSARTAYTKFRDHYNTAVALYASNPTVAFTELGRAVHFISDINEPHHASNAIAVLTNHSQFESRAEEQRNNCVLSSITLTQLNINKGLTLQGIADASGVNARQWYSLASNNSTMDQAVKPTLQNAQSIVAGVLYKFMSEVG